ncbi:hypothetical protein Mapa_015828 [Marchantia paleacea]|nr:hypothetical protein Mapa_015828 [Marchantia paleacea]
MEDRGESTDEGDPKQQQQQQPTFNESEVENEVEALVVQADCVVVDDEKVEDVPQVVMEDSQKPSWNVTGQEVIRVGKEILLQAFNWESQKHSWWKTLETKIPQIAAAGFTALWLPPSSDSLAREGYLPKDLYSLNTAYGSESELKLLIQTIKDNNMKAMADIVINHRIGSTKGVGGIYNRYDGMPMPWDEHAVTCDTGGLGNPSTGEIFQGAPNIDHTQEFVRNDLKEWLRWLIKDVGYNSFRFDFAKGYSASFVKEYIDASNPIFSVGEFWDTCNYHGSSLDYDQDKHRQRTINWIDGAGGLACAFDFTTKAVLQEACRAGEWWRLRDPKGKPSGVMGMWPSRAVTFVENHDTGSTQGHWPFPSEHILKGYAYILTHPGQPTVFYDHFFDWGENIRNAIIDLMQIRKKNGVHSRSSVRILEANDSVYAASIDGRLSVKLGDGNWDPGWGWNVATSGQSYAVWERHMWPEGEQPKM